MKFDHRTLTAVFVSPVAGCLAGTLTFGVINAALSGTPIHWSSWLALPFYGFAYRVTVGVVAMLLLGVPAYWILKRFRITALVAYAVVGALVGCITPYGVMALAALGFGASYPWERAMDDASRTVPLAAWLGVCISVIAWLIRRPNRDAPNPTTPAP